MRTSMHRKRDCSRPRNSCFLLAFVFLASASAGAAEAPAKPNVLLILADDLGFSDLGCYGGEIDTPNLDALAKGGLRFTRFYNTARCWPTRAAILTGYYAQQIRRDAVPGTPSGNRGVRPAWAKLLPDLLKPLGYRSYHSGKWHIDGLPLRNGFEHSYSLNDHDRHFAPKQHTEDDRPLPPADPKSGYYSSIAIADHAVAQLNGHFAKRPDEPFFGFVAFTAPHFPLQAPADDVAKYKKKYLAGWDEMREQRWKRMKDLSLGDALSPVERDVGPPYAFPDAIEKLGPNELNRPRPWKDLTAEQKAFQADKMAVHAAMVDRMDREIGRILDALRKAKKLDDTLVVFLSDNGASAEMMVRGDGHDPHAECGTGATFLSIGPGWSSLCNAPFRRHKTWVHEGGIHTPFIVHWPNGFAAKGEVRHTPGHVVDFVPTALELAAGKPVAKPDVPDAPEFVGRSLAPAFAVDGGVNRDSLWWLHEGNRALRVGDWKIVAAGTTSAWELYDLKADPTETRNAAKDHPEKVRELSNEWRKQTDAYNAQAKKDAPPVPKKEPSKKPPPNIVFILADDLGAFDLACDGRRDHNTPNLDKLAAAGARFTSAYAAASICSPTRAALMTGQSPARLHITTFLPGRADAPSQKLLHPKIASNLAADAVTLPILLKADGYAVGCFGKWHLGGKGSQPADHGFDVYFSGAANTEPSAEEGGKGEFALTAAASAFVEKNKDRPFFLYLAHHAPHVPYAARANLIQANAAAFEPTYAAAVESLDESVGALLRKLESLGVAENTLVIFTSDNGGLHVPELKHDRVTHNGSLRAGKGFLYEGGLRVPLLVRWPDKVKPGTVIDLPVQTTDWLPTLLEAVGSKPPAQLDGASFAGVLTGTARPAERRLFWHQPHYTNQGGRPGSAVREGNWKLIEWAEDGSAELFDLATDPGEANDLSAKCPDRVKALREKLAGWRKEVGAQEMTPNPEFDAVGHKLLYLDPDPSKFSPATASPISFQAMQAWRKRMDAAVSAKK